MTEKEQFQFAAKAAGLQVTPCINGWDESYPMGWNPRDDDGDAFRLAVKLQMKVYPGEAYPWCKSSADYQVGYVCDEDECSDSVAATRLAIFLAAVEIGRNMP